VESILQNWGIRVTDWVPVQEADCFATLAYAEVSSSRSVGLNLLELRRELTRTMAAQDLQVRIQREDVFSAMHRL
jgi:predicted amino acid-binding ACT domain protein